MATVEERLAFETAWLDRSHDGRYEAAVRQAFECSVIRHIQLVNAALDTAEAARVAPVTTRVLLARRARLLRRAR